MTLLNLPPLLRSKTDNIKLVLLCREKYVSTYGWNEILKVLINDLKYLETHGITIKFDNEIMIYKGSLVVMFGDNLGSHQIGGYTENFSNSAYFCRYCEKSSAEFNSNPLKGKPLKKNKKMIKGIKADSALNDLQHYHVAKRGLPPCIAA